jgi:V/A-type H+-transporting ATPase subunit D
LKNIIRKGCESKISFREIKPTKTNLITLQKKLNFAQKGEQFLEYKREQLISLMRKNWGDYFSHRKRFLEEFRKVLIKLNQNYKEMGKKTFILISNVSKIQYEPKITVRYIKEFGNFIPKIDYELIRKEKMPAYSFENTSHYLDELIVKLQDFFENLILIAEKEGLMLSLSQNFKKINRRINALKNIIIPEQESELKKIKEILEETDRENYVRLKKTKDLIEKKQNII